MNAVNPCSVQIPNLFLPCVSYCFCSFQLLQYTDPAQLTQLRTLDTLQFSFLAKLLCFLQITDRQLTFWYTQCSKISHFNFSGKTCSCLVSFLCNSVSRMPSTTFFSPQFPEKSWDGEWVIKEILGVFLKISRNYLNCCLKPVSYPHFLVIY